MRPNLQETADLATFTEEILNGKLNMFCSVKSCYNVKYRQIFQPASVCLQSKISNNKE